MLNKISHFWYNFNKMNKIFDIEQFLGLLTMYVLICKTQCMIIKF